MSASGMEPSHLHLHVRDVERGRRFYESWFGLAESARHGPILFLASPGGFALALAPDPAPAALPAWFHFGFRLASPAEVRALHDRMRDAGVAIARPLVDDPDLVSYSCLDPDGYRIEVYWE